MADWGVLEIRTFRILDLDCLQSEIPNLQFERLHLSRKIYGKGADVCSCTINHLPPSFWKMTVQRRVANSCLPATVTASSLLVASAQVRLPSVWIWASSVRVSFRLLYPFSSSVTPF